jgi:glucokinase
MVALESEGGHATCAPFDDRESELLCVLRRRFGHVSAERCVSGPGLANLHAAIVEINGGSPEVLRPADVTARALSGECRWCKEAVDVFCGMLGTLAADLALTVGARGGVYIGGGIVPRLGESFANSPFRRRFENKGRFSAYLSAIPTFVVTHETPALLGLTALLEESDAEDLPTVFVADPQ